MGWTPGELFDVTAGIVWQLVGERVEAIGDDRARLSKGRTITRRSLAERIEGGDIAMTEETGKEQSKAAKRGFSPGVSGNPNGRPKGSRNKVTLAIEALLEGEAEALTRKAIERALEGDGTALRLCLDRLAPPRRDRPAPFDLPSLNEAADCRDAFAAIVAATAEGELTPSEGTTMAKLVEGFAAVDEATDAYRRARDRKKNGLSAFDLDL